MISNLPKVVLSVAFCRRGRLRLEFVHFDTDGTATPPKTPPENGRFQYIAIEDMTHITALTRIFTALSPMQTHEMRVFVDNYDVGE